MPCRLVRLRSTPLGSVLPSQEFRVRRCRWWLTGGRRAVCADVTTRRYAQRYVKNVLLSSPLLADVYTEAIGAMLAEHRKTVQKFRGRPFWNPH